jgi:4-hydroxy-3-polyprenylbenzoate decarboxylase
MAYQSLAEFLEQLDHAGQLMRVSAEVDPELELGEIARRLADQGGPAVLFQRVKGCRGAVVANLMTGQRRIALALGAATLVDAAQRLSEALAGRESAGWLSRLRQVSAAGDERWQPKLVKHGPSQQVVRLGDDIDLGSLPAARLWPEEPRRLLRGGLLFSADRAAGTLRVSRCDLELIDARRAALICDRWQPIVGHLADDRPSGQPTPIAVAFGGDPTLGLMAATPLTAQADRLALAGALRGQPCELVKCRTNSLRVPADADLVIEAVVDPAEPPASAGPIGLAHGRYLGPLSAPLIEAAAMTERNNLLLPLAVGAASQAEFSLLLPAMGRVLLPLIQAIAPEVTDLQLEGHELGVVALVAAIRKRYPMQARRVASALWGFEPLMAAAWLIVVDEGIDTADRAAVWRQVTVHADPRHDVFHQLTPASSQAAATGETWSTSLGIDATAKLPGEPSRPRPAEAIMSEEIRNQVGRRWAELALDRAVGRL